MIRPALDLLRRESDNTYVILGTTLGTFEAVSHIVTIVLVTVLVFVACDSAHKAIRNRHRATCTTPARTEVTQVTACYCDTTQYL